MAPSVMAYLQKIQDGVIFSEGFENQNWLAAEGWTADQGTPVISNGVAEKGLFSFKCTGTTSTLSIISKALSSNAQLIFGWFFDDSTQTTQPGPYLKVHFTNGQYMSVGVRNSVSTTVYSYVSPGAVDQPTSVTALSRTTGWHQFGIDTINGELYIDKNIYATFTAGLLIDTIYIQSGKVGDTGTTFGYFDEINAYISSSAKIIFGDSVSRAMRAYDSSNNLGVVYSPAASDSIYFNNTFLTLPSSIFLEISKPVTYTSLEWRSPLTAVNPGDIYIYQPINFQRKCTNWSPKEDLLTNQNISASGITETLMNGFKPKHILTVNQLQGQDMKIAINNFFNYCKQGFPFSMMIDTAFPGFGVLSAAPAVAAQSVTVMATLSTNPNDNFTVGRQYRIFDAHGQRRQKVTLASKTSTTQLNFVEYLTQPFAQGDYICDDTFLPLLELGANPDGFNMKDPRYIFFDWVQSCQEFTGA